MVEACGIVVILDRGGLIPGRAHIFVTALRLPICDGDDKSAMLSSIVASIKASEDITQIDQREPRSLAMGVATRWQKQK